jgi:hypothetical protein
MSQSSHQISFLRVLIALPTGSSKIPPGIILMKFKDYRGWCQSRPEPVQAGGWAEAEIPYIVQRHAPVSENFFQFFFFTLIYSIYLCLLLFDRI